MTLKCVRFFVFQILKNWEEKLYFHIGSLRSTEDLSQDGMDFGGSGKLPDFRTQGSRRQLSEVC